MQEILLKFSNLNYKIHLVLAFFIRLIFIGYSVIHDQYLSVPYTDVDYKVFTDASRHILNLKSPYDRHTYRYTPLVAILLVPNLLVQYCFGKLLFSVIDILVGLLIRLILKNTLEEYKCYKIKIEAKTLKGENKFQPIQSAADRRQRRTHRTVKLKQLTGKSNKFNVCNSTVNYSMLIWLYNPMTIAIATRGNCDSLAGFLVLLTLYFLQCKRQIFTAGLIHGLAVHVRLYPIAYSLALFMHLSTYSFYTSGNRKNQEKTGDCANLKHLKNIENRIVQTKNLPTKQRRTIFKKQYLLYLHPNFDQFKLIAGFLLSVSFLTALFYYLYGYKFLYETYIFHLVRKDTRHNFSVYFYLQYLTAAVKNVGMWQKVLTVLPQVILLIVFSVRYGLNRLALHFSILTLTFVMVSYNTVLTSQYFVWIIAIFPLCLWQIKMSVRAALFWFAVWYGAQGCWLLPAYFLEFHGQNTFLFIWVQGVSFFCVHMAILGRLVSNFMTTKKNVD